MKSLVSATEARKIFNVAKAGRADIDVAGRVLWSPISQLPRARTSVARMRTSLPSWTACL